MKIHVYVIFILLHLTYSCQQQTTIESAVDSMVVVVPAHDRGDPAVPGEQSIPDMLHLLPFEYEVITMTKGDLNLDSLDDYVLIVTYPDSQDTSAEAGFIKSVLLCTGQAGRPYQLTNLNIHIVYPDNDVRVGSEIVIKNGYFSIEQFGKDGALNWVRIVTFKYSPQDKNWYLHKDGGEMYHPVLGDPENQATKIVKTSKDFGLIAFEDFSIYKDQWQKSE